MLIGKRNGTFVIPPAHITMNGKTIASKAIKVNIVGNKKEIMFLMTTTHQHVSMKEKLHQQEMICL